MARAPEHVRDDATGSLESALALAAGAGQDLVADQLALARLEVEEVLGRRVELGAWWLVAGGLLLLGWLGVLAATAVALAAFVPVWLALAIVALMNLALGGALLLKGPPPAPREEVAGGQP